mmetsp:Transcript_20741/g.29810  ORF Transcript_20741/g.29810 Transcript_20741/m.29810 type:complete len:82 (+) Transcript_20741:52-297(+)
MDTFLRDKRKKLAILRAKDIGVRRRCIKEWNLLNNEQKILTRSLRAKKGIQCEVVEILVIILKYAQIIVILKTKKVLQSLD